MNRRWLWVAALAALTPGCGSPTELIVVVDSDLTLDELDHVFFEVDGRPVADAELTADGRLPLTLGLSPGAGQPTLAVTVRGRADGAEVARVEADAVPVLAGERSAFYVFLSRRSEGCALPWDPQLERPSGRSRCASTPSDGGLDAGLVDGGPDASPLDAGPSDAGPSDASPSDAGPDATPPDTGPDAAPPDAGPRDAGPFDPTDAGCQGHGDCDDGDPCTDDLCLGGGCTFPDSGDGRVCGMVIPPSQCMYTDCAAAMGTRTYLLQEFLCESGQCTGERFRVMSAPCGGPTSENFRCNSQFAERCCGGTCVDTSADAAHCGGCGIECAEGCQESGGAGVCTCNGPPPLCPNGGAQWTCGGAAGARTCACDGPSACADGQTCSSSQCRYVAN